MNTGRLYINAAGEVAKQTTKQIPGIVGAVACNNVAVLQQLSQEQLQETDCLGRSAAMLAALYRSWEVLDFLLQSASVVNWLQVRSVMNFCLSYCVIRSSPQGLQSTVCDVICAHEHTLYSPNSLVVADVQKETRTGMSAIHFIAQHTHHDRSEEYNRVISSLPADLPLSVINASDQHDFVPLDIAILSRNKLVFKWLLRHGAEPDGEYKQQLARGCLHQAHPLPLANALSGLHATYTRSLLEAGATLFRANDRLCTDLSDWPARPHHFIVRCPDHLPVLVEYGVFLHALRLDGSRGTVLDTINGPSCSSRFHYVTAAVNKGLAPRRHLLVMILAGRSQPHLTQDVVQLICRHADLLPYKQPSYH